MKSKIAALLILLLAGILNYAHAGFEIFVRPQVSPQYITVNGAYGAKEQRLNPGQPIALPVGIRVFRPANFSPYSTAQGNRSELWRTATGTATDAEIFAAFPGLKAKITEEITSIRQQALDRAARSAGVFSVYDQNWAAANGAPMKTGESAQVYLQGMGSEIDLTADQFKAYIVSENKRVTGPASMEERQYLWFTRKVIPAETSVEELLDLPAQYRRYCGL